MPYDPRPGRNAAEAVQPLTPEAPVAYENLIDYLSVGADWPAYSDLNSAGLPNAAKTQVPGLRPVVFEELDAKGRPDPRHSPAIRAVFYDVEGDVPLQKKERSVVFGFTSNFGPAEEATEL